MTLSESSSIEIGGLMYISKFFGTLPSTRYLFDGSLHTLHVNFPFSATNNTRLNSMCEDLLDWSMQLSQ